MPDDFASPLRKTIEAFNDRGVDAALEYFDQNVQWWAPPDWLEDRLYEGHDGVRRLAAFWNDQFEEYRVEPNRFIDLGDGELVALLHQRGRIKGSTDQVEQELGYIAQIRDGTLTDVQVYFSWEATLEAAGLPDSAALKSDIRHTTSRIVLRCVETMSFQSSTGHRAVVQSAFAISV